MSRRSSAPAGDRTAHDGRIDVSISAPSLHAVAEYLGFRFVPELPARLDGAVLALFPGRLARLCAAVPLGREAGTLVVALQEPHDEEKRALLLFALSGGVRFVVADPEKIGWLLQLHFGAAETPTHEDAPIDGDLAPLPTATETEESGAIVEFVASLLGDAARAKASDIHLEPFENEFRIRFRVDGTLHERPAPPHSFALPVISRLKVLANLDIAERRVPQDGRIALTVGTSAIDFRVSTLPTPAGESVVLRVLDQSALHLNLHALGLPPAMERDLCAAIRRPNGIVIVTGPTGSGKTTTLYACLREINEPDVKVLTVEDPVEYEIDGVMQTPVNAAAGLDFAAALKAFLRHDPDVVMIGEIRDLETARTALQAALTGHLVLTTLHTNDAIGAVTRLVDMGVEPFLIASTVQAVVAQRLVRQLCRDCRGQGCPRCHHGYAGRIPVFEYVQMTDALRDAVAAGAPLADLRAIAEAAGTISLRVAAERLVASGETTRAEINRHL